MKPARGAAAELFPSVRFTPDFARRLERSVLFLASARERREGPGGSALAGRGEEFVGFRPYRAGEDFRAIDWNLMARLDRPFVRSTRREASERWVVLIDASASMAVGPPGKLQAAAELAAALAAQGVRQRARVTLVTTSEGDPERSALDVRGRHDLGRLLAFLESLAARGPDGLHATLSRWRPPALAGRIFVLGDLCDLEPGGLALIARPGRELFALQILAPCELDPRAVGGVEMLDPESGARLPLVLGARLRSAYQRELERTLGSWRSSCARHGIRYACCASNQAFEDFLPRLFGLAV